VVFGQTESEPGTILLKITIKAMIFSVLMQGSVVFGLWR